MIDKTKNFIVLNVNNFDYYYNCDVTIYQALLQKGWYIPRFCYHVKLALAGNCRMCFVEVLNISKPIIACATSISKNMYIFTSSINVFKAREGILEFLLINHPIDCPVCDQGGECDLQDQYVVMGSLISRFYDLSKKSIKNKNLSFLIKLSLNKCINCTRCTRYSQSVTGEYSFSLLGRGENSFISNYINSSYIGEITGNVMDLCPVGAITSKLIAYDFRLWELVEIKFLDFMDIMHPPIRIDFRGLKVLRILPLSNSVIQEEWISDKLRYNLKTFFKNRYFLPFMKKKNIFINFSWNTTFITLKNCFVKILNFFNKKKFFFILNKELCNYTTDMYNFYFYKKYFNKISLFNSFKYFKNVDNKFRNNFMFINKDLDFLKTDRIIFINVNLRYELPLLNYKIREKVTFDFIEIFLLGPILNLNYFFLHLGNNLKYIYKYLTRVNFKKQTVVFYGNLKNNLNYFLSKLNNKYFFLYNVSDLNNLNLMFLEFGRNKSIQINKFKKNYCVNFISNNISQSINSFCNKNMLNIYLSQNIFNTKFYNFILPKKFNFEQNSFFLNIFGIFNDYTFIIYKSNCKTLKNDWHILEDLFNKFNFKLKISLSLIKSKYIPKKWIFNEYSLKLYKFNYFKHNKLFLYNKKNYFYVKINSFFTDKFSKNNSLFAYFDILKKFNLFNLYQNINEVYWIF